ncbi:putative acyl-activating enzyme 19 isoform X1 [Dioscorea cayenensis subsp. rotundata]|uniref:4-coumarate--CoA ligase n=1 Tax=Dioscorea cayennensis subsp. rotundata TaxID=55577 RepID=A0AB40BPR3_DIOCR|nr:putative acyl-activating enzyme 19 isoform X1 [Dioscorea cayenensis subsp. rotundata]
MASMPCCISHEFYRVASENTDRVAAVRASGGLRVCKDALECLLEVPERFDFESRHASSSFPPVYPGDECSSFADVLCAVCSLSWRIRTVLDGGDDPDLVRSQGFSHGDQTLSSSVSNNDTKSSSTETNGTPLTNGIPQIIGVFIAPSIEYIVAVLSILRCGEAFLPLDPSWPEERLLHVISSSKTVIILKDKPSCSTEVDMILHKGGCSVMYVSMEASLKENGACDLDWPCERKIPRRFCYLMYTSGSTGKPKGVCGTERGLLNRFWWMQQRMPLVEDDVLLFKTPNSFIDHLQEFLSSVLTCTTLIIPPFEELKANPLLIVNFLKAYHITRLTSVPSLMTAVLPYMENSRWMKIHKSLKLLVLSGEVLFISLWKSLHNLLPGTTILNLYGSTEVSGDCTYFDCCRLPQILDLELLSSVPIGVPLSNCEIALVGKLNEPNVGEIYVGGTCLMVGYLSEINHGHPYEADDFSHFRTGDFAKRLQSGDLILLGRKDRVVKVNGQLVALEEIENTLREHPAVNEAAATLYRTPNDVSHLVSYIVLKSTKVLSETNTSYVDESHNKELVASIKSWMVGKVPPAMVPSYYFIIDSLPTTSTGKVDYAMLPSLPSIARWDFGDVRSYNSQLQMIKEAFSEALLVKEVKDQDDFFAMGGNSIAAAHAAHRLAIDMRLLYMFPSPEKLLNSLLNKKDLIQSSVRHDTDSAKRVKLHGNIWSPSFGTTISLQSNGKFEEQLRVHTGVSVDNLPLKVNAHPPIRNIKGSNYESSGRHCPVTIVSHLSQTSVVTNADDSFRWISNTNLPAICCFSRSNRFMHEGQPNQNYVQKKYFYGRTQKGHMQELWKVPLNSCVDASSLIVFQDGRVYLFIGSHSHIFLCIDALSGLVQWEVMLGGRIECSAAITSDFSQVVVGCYKGKVYFLEYMSGNIIWSFQTDGEVKMQPVVDRDRNLIWCGSYDHFLYALDYKEHFCVYKISCGGSIYGSPSIDMVHKIIYVASTSGRVTAISLADAQFKVAWRYETGSPIFGSLCLDTHGNVICCLVDGHVNVLDSGGNVIWKAIVGGPIFAGACVSPALPSQVLICCRNGILYSFDMEAGTLLWEYESSDPITASAYIDEQICLASEQSSSCERLACICSCTGKVHVLKISSDIEGKRFNQSRDLGRPLVQEFAVMNLPGDVFSSPVMIGGRIFVGCRDDYVHCLNVVF